MLKVTKLSFLLAFFAGFMFFACSESDLRDEFSDEISSSSKTSGNLVDSSSSDDNSGNPSSSSVLGTNPGSSSEQGDGSSDSNGMVEKDGICYVCNMAKAECNVLGSWDAWIKNICTGNEEQTRGQFCLVQPCPGGIGSSSSSAGTSSSSGLGSSSSSATQSSSSAKTQATTCPIGNLVQLGSVPANPYTACFEYQGSCYTCKIESEGSGNTCASLWVWTTNGANDNIGKTNYWYQKVTCPAGVGGGTSSSSQAIVQSSSSQGSGTIDIGTPNGGKTGSGWSSRYWDGCKGSCGWSANANGNPTKSCAINGTSMVNMDTQSACVGGSAYTCYSQAPWAVSDNVAYGFAASHTNGDCGKCFRLTFTGQTEHVANSQGLSNLQGKIMVVKVSNIGGDVQGTQLDLMIPGGGLGIYDGFSSQTGVNTSVITGSARAGGFLTDCGGSEEWQGNFNNLSALKTCIKNKCDQAFTNSELLAGCKFYADWFEAVNNPRFNLTEVSCPAALEAKW